MNQRLDALGLEKHPDKTFIGRTDKRFDFLGCHFEPVRWSRTFSPAGGRPPDSPRVRFQGLMGGPFYGMPHEALVGYALSGRCLLGRRQQLRRQAQAYCLVFPAKLEVHAFEAGQIVFGQIGLGDEPFRFFVASQWRQGLKEFFVAHSAVSLSRACNGR